MISALAAEGAVVSVDTMRAEVAAAAVEAGATIVNDVSGGLADPEILGVVAAAGATYVAMHWRAHSDRMQHFAVVRRARRGGRGRPRRARRAGRRAARRAGVDRDRIVLDPGLGLRQARRRTTGTLLRGLDAIAGARAARCWSARAASRFLGALLADRRPPRPVDEREHAGTALTVLLAQRGRVGPAGARRTRAT